MGPHTKGEVVSTVDQSELGHILFFIFLLPVTAAPSLKPPAPEPQELPKCIASIYSSDLVFDFYNSPCDLNTSPCHFVSNLESKLITLSSTRHIFMTVIFGPGVNFSVVGEPCAMSVR